MKIFVNYVKFPYFKYTIFSNYYFSTFYIIQLDHKMIIYFQLQFNLEYAWKDNKTLQNSFVEVCFKKMHTYFFGRWF